MRLVFAGTGSRPFGRRGVRAGGSGRQTRMLADFDPIVAFRRRGARKSTEPRHSFDTISPSSEPRWRAGPLLALQGRRSTMLALVRASLTAALLILSSISAFSADNPYHRDDLAEAAIRLEAQIKADAGTVAKPLAALRRDADAAFARNDQKAGMQVLGQIVAVAPGDTANWLRLSRAILQVRPADDRERATLLERAAAAAYVAYQRTAGAGEEAQALVLLGRSYADRTLWRPALDALRLSLELREVADVRAQYEKMRDDHGFRLLDYAVDSDSASPRVCFQFSEPLPGKRIDLAPFVAMAGQDKPALSSDDRQLCVEGLKHGERYAITLRAGLPSTVQEALTKSADYSIYVRDRSPSARFTSKAYVLPRTGQRGIPVVTVNTASV